MVLFASFLGAAMLGLTPLRQVLGGGAASFVKRHRWAFGTAGLLIAAVFGASLPDALYDGACISPDGMVVRRAPWDGGIARYSWASVSDLRLECSYFPAARHDPALWSYTVFLDLKDGTPLVAGSGEYHPGEKPRFSSKYQQLAMSLRGYSVAIDRSRVTSGCITPDIQMLASN